VAKGLGRVVACATLCAAIACVADGATWPPVRTPSAARFCPAMSCGFFDRFDPSAPWQTAPRRFRLSRPPCRSTLGLCLRYTPPRAGNGGSTHDVPRNPLQALPSAVRWADVCPKLTRMAPSLAPSLPGTFPAPDSGAATHVRRVRLPSRLAIYSGTRTSYRGHSCDVSPSSIATVSPYLRARFPPGRTARGAVLGSGLPQRFDPPCPPLLTPESTLF
jgi:hypothetical protein